MKTLMVSLWDSSWIVKTWAKMAGGGGSDGDGGGGGSGGGGGGDGG